jgi:hypothetical protein
MLKQQLKSNENQSRFNPFFFFFKREVIIISRRQTKSLNSR